MGDLSDASGILKARAAAVIALIGLIAALLAIITKVGVASHQDPLYFVSLCIEDRRAAVAAVGVQVGLEVLRVTVAPH